MVVATSKHLEHLLQHIYNDLKQNLKIQNSIPFNCAVVELFQHNWFPFIRAKKPATKLFAGQLI
jgi:hypothetical protein